MRVGQIDRARSLYCWESQVQLQDLSGGLKQSRRMTSDILEDRVYICIIISGPQFIT